MKTSTIILRAGKLCLCWLMFLSAIAMPAVAQPLSVVLYMQPNPSPYLSDWEQRSETIVLTISNSSAQVQNVYFTGTVTGDNGVSGQTKQGFKPTRPLQVPPNTTTSYTGPQLKGMFVWEEIQSTGVNIASITRSGMLPEGNYELCVVAMSFQTDEVLTSVNPSGCTPSFTIALPQPPVVTTPPCEETVSSGQGQPILFSWMPMAGTPQRVQYRLRIVEIIGNRSANDALQSATTPPVFDKTISGNSYMLNPVQLVTPNRPGPVKFAWSVTAIDPSNKTSFSNNGESEACSFEYSKGSTIQAGPAANLVTVIKVDVGRRSKGCTGFGICSIFIDGLDQIPQPPPAADPPKKPDPPKEEKPKSIPDSRLDPGKPKVYAALQLSSDGKALSLSLSESDIKEYQPDKLKYFEGQTSVTFEEDNPVAPKIWMDYFNKANPVIIKAGTYPLKFSDAFYTIDSIRIAPLGTPPFYADIPPKDTVIADTIPCKELEAKIKAAEADLKKLKDELASLEGDGKYIDGKIKAEKNSAEICNRVLKGLQATSDSWKKSVDACEKLMKTEKPLTASTKERCAKVQKTYEDALAETEAQQKKCDKLAENIKALEARRAALIDLIRTGEGELGGLKEALEKCRKEAEEKKRKAEAEAARTAAEAGASSSGAGRRGPGSGAGMEGKPCDPEGKEFNWGPYKEWEPCRVEGEVELTPCGVTRMNNELLEYIKKIYEKVPVLSDAKDLAENIAKAGSLHKAVCVNIHIVRDWKMVTYHWKCIKGKWVLRKEVGKTGTVDLGWEDLTEKNAGTCCWVFAKDEAADSADLKERIQEKLDACSKR